MVFDVLSCHRRPRGVSPGGYDDYEQSNVCPTHVRGLDSYSIPPYREENDVASRASLYL